MDTLLELAVDRFLQQARESGAEGIVSSVEELNAFDHWFPGLLPTWYRELLATKPIGNLGFSAEVRGISCEGEGLFRDAATLLGEVEDAFPDVDLAQRGFLMICDAGDGDGWVIRADSTPDDPIEFVYLSDGGAGSLQDSDSCLISQGETLAEFLSALKPITALAG